MNNTKLGVGIIGLGVGEQHAAAYVKHPNCEIKILCDLDIDKARRVKESLGSGDIVTDYRRVIQRDDVDIVSVASYDDDHYEQIALALKAGKHVFSEKPLVQNMEHLRSVKQLWAGSGGKSKLYCNLVLRSVPLYIWLREQILAGVFGEIYSFEGDYLYGRIHKLISGWRGHRDNYSAILGGGIHLIDLMVWLTNNKPERVFMVGNKICTKGTDVKHEDFVEALLLSKDNVVSKISSNLGCMHRHQHVIRIFGTKATFIYDDQGPRIHYTRDPSVRASSIDLPALPASKGILIGEFVDAILQEKNITDETQSMFDSASIGISSQQSLMTQGINRIEYV